MGPDGALALLDGFSLEITGRDVAAIQEAAAAIPAGTKVNVTYLENEDLDMRVRAAKAVRELGLVPVPHIAARRVSSQDQLEEFLGRLREVGATENLFVVGGDPTEAVGPYPHALSVIESGLLPAYGAKEVSIAGYPEGHPAIADDILWRHLDDKTTALAAANLSTVIATQFTFDTDPVVSWIDAVRDRGIDSRIRIGTPGPAGIKRLLGFARRLGIGTGAGIVKKYGFSLTNLLGTAGPDRFVDELSGLLGASRGKVGLHFYTFGGLLATAEWIRDYRAARS